MPPATKSPGYSLRRRLVSPRSRVVQQRWGSSEEGSILGCLPAYVAAEETFRRNSKRAGKASLRRVLGLLPTPRVGLSS